MLEVAPGFCVEAIVGRNAPIWREVKVGPNDSQAAVIKLLNKAMLIAKKKKMAMPSSIIGECSGRMTRREAFAWRQKAATSKTHQSLFQ